jgi:Protein of unknown function (DUF1444)
MFGLFGSKKPRSTHLDPSTIIPRIKHLKLLETPEPVLACIEQHDLDAELQLPVTRPLAGDLLVSYVSSLPDVYQFVSRQNMLELKLDAESIYQLALGNLRRLLPHVDVQDLGLFKAIVTNQHLEACSLLSANLWDRLSKQAAGDLLMAVPAQGSVFFTDSQFLFKDAGPDKCMDVMCSVAKQVRTDEPGAALSNCIFAWIDGRWVVRGDIDNPSSAVAGWRNKNGVGV